MKIITYEKRPAKSGFDHAEGMIRQGDRAQANYRKSETLPSPIRHQSSPGLLLECKKMVLGNLRSMSYRLRK